MYIPLFGFQTHLREGLPVDGRHLPIPETAYQHLLLRLDDGDWSYLELREGRVSEVVRVHNVCGKLVIDRGVECTAPRCQRCGIGVFFVMTAQGVRDAVCQMTDKDCEKGDCP